MNAEKYTQKALEAVKTAQNMAQENGNQYVTTEHLLYALLDQDGGSAICPASPAAAARCTPRPRSARS